MNYIQSKLLSPGGDFLTAADNASLIDKICRGIIVTTKKVEESKIETGVPFQVDDYKETKNYKFDAENMIVKVFAPRIFRDLRSTFNITSEVIENEWTLSDENKIVKLGAGRSGSIFCLSQNKHLIFKTIFPQEVETLITNLFQFHQRLQSNPSSLLMRIFGCYYVEVQSREFHIIVFNNLMKGTGSVTAPISEIWDLKGRKPKPGHQFQTKKEEGKIVVFKDKDLNRHFYFSQEQKDQLFHHLVADVQFLQSLNIMDYSFFIAVKYDEALVVDENTESISLFQRDFGGIRSAHPEHRNEIYFMGIIDCLTTYGLRKKVAHYSKKIRWSPAELSTVDAEYYAARFLEYLRLIIE